MRYWSHSLLILIHLLLLPTPVYADSVSGQAQIIDGDSIRIQGISIRLDGIDAPEMKQKCWYGASESTWNYQEIADWFNDNDYTTPRGKKFFNSSAQSIVKKKKLRDARLSKRHPWKLSDFGISFVDKTIINLQHI
jgi:hypothetical protein|tara:strand:- start:1363 stop:1770 length:408 start_codon:yes stop_codon:yes gene_type:complete